VRGTSDEDGPDVAAGAITYSSRHAAGGVLQVGDPHTTLGRGEVSGIVIEQRATVMLQVDLIKS